MTLARVNAVVRLKEEVAVHRLRCGDVGVVVSTRLGPRDFLFEVEFRRSTDSPKVRALLRAEQLEVLGVIRVQEQQRSTRMNGRTYNSLLMAALSAILLLNGCERQQAVAPPSVPEVGTVTIETKKIVLTTELPGRTSSYLVAEIRPQVSGLVQKRHFTEGMDVKAGEPLYQIAPAPFQAALNSANAALDASRKIADRARAGLNASIAGVARQKATLALAQINRRRFEDLLARNAVSTLERDQRNTDADVAESTLHAAEAQVESDRQAVAAAEASIKQAEGALETAQINLGYTRITAPVSGRIGRSNVTDGAIVTAYQPLPLATIQPLDPIYVDVLQSTTELLRLKQRMGEGRLHGGADQDQVQLLLEDGRAYPLKGTLQFRDISVDATTGSVILRMVFPNPDGVLLPGMFVRAVVIEGIKDAGILIPQQSVGRDPKGDPFAWVVDKNGKVERRLLSVDRAIDDQWLVSSGLKPGEHVVVEGLQRVRPGAMVKEVPFKVGQKELPKLIRADSISN